MWYAEIRSEEAAVATAAAVVVGGEAVLNTTLIYSLFTLMLIRTGVLPVVMFKEPKEITRWRRLRKERRKRKYRLKGDGNKE